MKKAIYNITSAPTSKIWRNNTEPTGELTPAQEMETKFNDYSQYIIGDKNSTDNFNFPTTILEEYPEYLAEWKTIITNIGLVCFVSGTYTKNEDEYDSETVYYYYEDETYKRFTGEDFETGIDYYTFSGSLVIYDMFDDDVTPDGPDTDLSFLSDIKPDISMLKMYNMFEQPLSVRKINFANSEFTPERSYVYDNKWCGFFNCDGVNNNIRLNDNFFFEFEGDKPDIENIQFNYKPLFVFKIYNTDGSKKISSDLKILIDGKEAEADSERGFYFIDLSDYKIENRSLLPLQISISLEDCGNGYLEVI